MMTDKPTLGPATTKSDQIALRTIGERRRRVIRSALGVIGVAILLIFLTALNRDRQARESCTLRMRQAVKLLHDNHQTWLKNPARFPLEPVRTALGPEWRSHVFENSRFTELAAYARVVGVCCCAQPHSRPFQPALRDVIVFHVRAQTYELRAMEEPDFVDQADELGLRGVLLSR